MNLSLISFNFKTTPIELREKLALTQEQTEDLLREIKEQCQLGEVMIVSTCNRVEFYFPDDEHKKEAIRLLEWLKNRFEVSGEDLEKAAVILTQRSAQTHLFRVAGSLESMVLGESQVLGQVKDAYQLSISQDCQGPLLIGLMPRVFRTAKRVRSETGIARFPVSISFVAVQLASTIFESLENKTVLVIGAGDMAELTVVHLLKAGINRPLIINRTFTNAVALAERFQGSAIRFEELETYLAEADIVISSTGSQGFVVTPEMARNAVKKRKGEPIFFIDIAVPRDIDPEVNQISNVYNYDIDDLQAVADANKQERENEALLAQVIIEEEINIYEKWVDTQTVIPTVKALRNQFTEIGEQELKKILSKMENLSGRDELQIRKGIKVIINKLLHHPSTHLKNLSDDINGSLYVDTLSTLFNLDLYYDGGESGENFAENTGEVAEDGSDNVVHLPIKSNKST